MEQVLFLESREGVGCRTPFSGEGQVHTETPAGEFKVALSGSSQLYKTVQFDPGTLLTPRLVYSYMCADHLAYIYSQSVHNSWSRAT